MTTQKSFAKNGEKIKHRLNSKLGIFFAIIFIGGWLMSYQHNIITSFILCFFAVLFILNFYVLLNEQHTTNAFMIIWFVILSFFSTHVEEGYIHTSNSIKYTDGGYYLPFVHAEESVSLSQLSGILNIKNSLPKSLEVRIWYAPPKRHMDLKEWKTVLELKKEGVEVPTQLLVPSKNDAEDIHAWFQDKYPYSKVSVDVLRKNHYE